jgi:hypothetical protein
MIKIGNMFLIALAFLVIFAVIHSAAMMVDKEKSMGHVGLGIQAFLAGLSFYLLCRFVPALHKTCCDM